MAYKDFKPKWTSVFKNDGYAYGNYPFRAGGSNDYHSFLGFPDEIKEAVRTSSTTAKLSMRFRVRQGSQVDIGHHSHTSKPTGNLPFYAYNETIDISKGWVDYGMSNYFLPKFMDGSVLGMVFYSTTHYSVIENSGSDEIIFRVEGTWNRPPYKPKLITPKRKQRVDDSLKIEWKYNGDPDGDKLKARVAMRAGDGKAPTSGPGDVTGSYRVYYTNYSQTSLTIDTSDWAEGTNANISIRAVDPDDARSDFDNNVFEINHNKPPTKPKLISPSGNETWNKEHTIKWEASTDPNNDDLEYQIQLTTNDGKNWDNIMYRTDKNVTSYTYNFENEDATSVARIGIRAYDGEFYSSWDRSDGVFTIQHNVAPDEPDDLSPNGLIVDKTRVQILSWQFRDPNTNDTQTKFDLRWREKGTSIWNDITQKTSDESISINSGTFPDGDIEWQVRTYDEGGLQSPWSSKVIFTSAEPTNEPLIQEPDANVIIARPTIKWSSSNQKSYEVNIGSPAGYAWESGETKTSNQAVTIPVDLENETHYTIRVRVKDESGIWSSWASKDINVSFFEPLIPTVEVFDNEDSTISVVIDNPVPDNEAVPEVVNNCVFRRDNSEWIKIADKLPPNANFTDYAPASGVDYEYYVRSNGDVGTYINSDTQSIKIKFMGVQLHLVDNPETLHNFRADGSGRDYDWQADSTSLHFAGRPYPVTYFSENENESVNVNLKMFREWQDHEMLHEIIKAKEIVCYRDGRGRKVFGTINELPVSDEFYGYTTSITVNRTSYKEGVDDA